MRNTVIALFAILILSGCGGPPPAASVTSVTIDGGDRTIVLGDALTLTTTVVTSGGASSAATWSSSNQSIATVAADGQVTSLADGTTTITATSTDDPTKSDAITLTVDPLGALRWTRQFGTSSNDDVRGIATDADGNVYVAGYTPGDLDGSNAGGADAFVRSYDGTGELRWTRQFGTSGNDRTSGIATDAAGNVYAIGYTDGDLGGSNAGANDAFVSSYDGDGNVRWTRQFGTSGNDIATGVATDANGHVYVAGYTFGDLEGVSAGSQDAFLRSYDSDGNVRWTRQIGTSSADSATGVAIDTDGIVYVAGWTNGDVEGSNAGGYDAYIRSFDSDGNQGWTRQFGTTGDDFALGITTDPAGHVYATGITDGALEGSNAGVDDAFVRSYNSAGNLRWTRQFGTTSDDIANAIATDGSGNVYATGYTMGDLDGSNAGLDDAFVHSYDRDGILRWTRQFGTSSDEAAFGIATDTSGTVFTTGETFGDLEGSNAGSGDAFIRAYGR